MGLIKFINNLICVLGCVAVALALGVLLWLPTRPFARLQINLTADSQPVLLNVTGYEALTLANGITAISAKAVTAFDEINSREGGDRLLAQYDMNDGVQGRIRTLAAQTQPIANFVLLYQIAFFVLPALTLFMVIIVALSRGYFAQQLVKGLVLIALTFATVAITAGTMLFLSERLNAVIAASIAQNAAGFPGLGVSVNDKLPELRVGLINLIDTRTPIIASGVALVGSIVAMLGACLSARKPGLNPRLIAQAAMAQAQLQTNGARDAIPYSSAQPVQPTQRLPQPENPAPVVPAPVVPPPQPVYQAAAAPVAAPRPMPAAQPTRPTPSPINSGAPPMQATPAAINQPSPLAPAPEPRPAPTQVTPAYPAAHSAAHSAAQPTSASVSSPIKAQPAPPTRAPSAPQSAAQPEPAPTTAAQPTPPAPTEPAPNSKPAPETPPTRPPQPAPVAAQVAKPSPGPAAQPTPPRSPAKPRICATCGQIALGNEKFCRSCGARLGN